MSSPFEAVSTYFFAKDGNRPFLMRRAFAGDAELEMLVKTDAISFPQLSRGLGAIEDVLGRRFSNDFENVYTFCLSRPLAANRNHFPCNWLVGMSAKNNGPIRVGCGRYDWYFGSDERCLVKRLIITIDVMQLIPSAELDTVMNWITSLPYPWCDSGRAMMDLPGIGELGPVRQYLKGVRAIPPEC